MANLLFQVIKKCFYKEFNLTEKDLVPDRMVIIGGVVRDVSGKKSMSQLKKKKKYCATNLLDRV